MMSIETGMSTLELGDRRKRRYSDLFQPPPQPTDVNQNFTDIVISMDEENEQPVQNLNDSQIETNVDSDGSVKRRHSNRKRVATSFFEATETRDKPVTSKKINNQDIESIKSYYLDRTIKRLPSTLETIFEVPQECNDGMVLYWSKRKYRRSLNFTEICDDSIKRNPTKIKKRSMKIKSMNAKMKLANRKKISMQYVKKYLAEVDEHEN